MFQSLIPMICFLYKLGYNLADCSPVGEGVSEMRIHVGAGYRVYYKQVGMEIFLLLAGGDKSTQQRDIETALELARKIKE